MTIVVGVSIAVPEPFGELLRKRRLAYGDQLAERIPTHITLAPPLSVEPSGVEDLAADLAEIAEVSQPFRVSLLGTGTFRPISPVVFVAVSEGIAQIEALAHGVRSVIDAPEPEFPFHPHVTVAHHLDDAALDRALTDLRNFSCDFVVSSIHLYEDEPDQGWVPTREFAFGG